MGHEYPVPGGADIITIAGVRCHPLDPSSDPTGAPSSRDHGISCKTICDCTVPFDQKARFKRARFLDVDPENGRKVQIARKVSDKNKNTRRE